MSLTVRLSPLVASMRSMVVRLPGGSWGPLIHPSRLQPRPLLSPTLYWQCGVPFLNLTIKRSKRRG